MNSSSLSSYSPHLTYSMDTHTVTPPLITPPPITTVRPLSYQFQVVEYTKDNKIMKVEMQVQVTIHDERGNVISSSGYKPVPRIQLPYVEHSV